MANRSLINCSMNQLPRSPRIQNYVKAHEVVTEENFIEEILKWCPSMKNVALVSKAFFKVASKIRQERDWLVLQDHKTVLDSHILLKISEQKYNHIHIGKFEVLNENEVNFEASMDLQSYKIDDNLCNTSFYDVEEIVGKHKSHLQTLELTKVQISLTNLFDLLRVCRSLTDLRLIHVEIVNSNGLKPLIKFESNVKKMCIYECESSESVSAFIDAFPGKALEELFIRVKSVDNLRKFIQRNKELKTLNLQLLEQDEPLDRYLLFGIELEHLTIYAKNKEHFDSVIEKQTKLKSFDSKMRLSSHVIERLSEFEGIKNFSFRGDKIESEDIEKVAKWENLESVVISFNSISIKTGVYLGILSPFLRNQYKYSLNFAENATHKSYKLSKPLKLS